MKKLFLSLIAFLMATNAHAVCPVCSVAMGGGLIFAREFGIDDVITGLWFGALTLSMAMWLANYMRRRGVTKSWPYVLDLVGFYALTFSVYFLPDVQWGAYTLWGIDKLFLGIITGSVLFWLSAFSYSKMKKNNGGHALFPFQKVVMPIAILGAASVIFWLITRQ
ncbi:MAG: hypothetical protein LBG89_02875 [Rickettsiales bacterium]|jgi:hypothetical protein|nr:hypothetical protein [Rickettsiales bacterium]